eukprot:83021_1
MLSLGIRNSPSQLDVLSKCNERFKRSLDLNRQIFAYYGLTFISFIIGTLCAVLALFIWFFIQFYHYYCLIFEIKSNKISLNDRAITRVIVLGPFQSGCGFYTERLSDLYELQRVHLHQVFRSNRKGKYEMSLSLLKKYDDEDEGWIMDLSSNCFFAHKYLLPLATHLVWIDHPVFIMFSRLCLHFYAQCLFGTHHWSQTFAIWDSRCDIIWQYQNMKMYRQNMLKQYEKYCDSHHVQLITITDIQQENSLLQYV